MIIFIIFSCPRWDYVIGVSLITLSYIQFMLLNVCAYLEKPNVWVRLYAYKAGSWL